MGSEGVSVSIVVPAPGDPQSPTTPTPSAQPDPPIVPVPSATPIGVPIVGRPDPSPAPPVDTPETSEPPASPAPPAPTPATSTPVAPRPPDAAAPPHLPRTGVEVLALLLIAAVLLALGTLLVRAGRTSTGPGTRLHRRT